MNRGQSVQLGHINPVVVEIARKLHIALYINYAEPGGASGGFRALFWLYLHQLGRAEDYIRAVFQSRARQVTHARGTAQLVCVMSCSLMPELQT
jgi:hypothetical protein